MFRFNIRDMLWLTALIGLVLVWRQENQARQMMDAVDWAVGDRDRLVAKGEKLLAELAARGKRGTPPPSRGSWRTEKEAKAIQEAQARGER